ASNNVIIQVARVEKADHHSIVGQINNLLNALPDANIKVVFQGQALSLLLVRESRVQTEVESLVKAGVVFAACRNAMERAKIMETDLIPGVGIVPSALAEVVLKQNQGWAYLRIGT